MDISRTVGALCGIAAPVAFVGAWLVGGLQTSGYDPIGQAISQLAREGAPTRTLMTTGLVAFGLLMPVWARVLAHELGSRTVGRTVTVAGLATLAVALLPLSREGVALQDSLHAVAAGVGYVAMALTPLVAAGALRRGGHGRAATASQGVGLVSVVALVGTVSLLGFSGGLQRLGLGVVDVWHVAAGVWVLRRTRSG
ncbi:MAG: DUF998 domain-containing protein [Mycobacteriales bacterium]